MSDHDIVYVESESTPQRVAIPKRKIFLYNKADYDPLKKELHDFQAEFATLSGKNTMDLWDIFKSKLEDLADKYIKTKTISHKHKLPYFNSELSKLNKKVHKLYLKRKLNTKSNNHYKSVKATFQKELRQAYWSYIDHFFSFDSPNIAEGATRKTSKKCWSFVKSQRNDNGGVSPLRQNGVLTSDSVQKAEFLYLSIYP